ncbi:MAG TPA: PepSY domain-containing protein [Candidatus Acidoferrum sp.]|nr:PepSY domain-containing protein [Candidatus Acidoferrum sp.]
MKLVNIVLCLMLCAGIALAQGEKSTPVSKEQASKTALDMVKSGVVQNAELKMDNGKQAWAVDIAADNKVQRVWVDAHSGKIIRTELRPAATDTSEKSMDRAEKVAVKEIPGEVVKRSLGTAKKQATFQFLIKGKRGQLMKVDVSKKTYKVLSVTPAALEGTPRDSTK